MKLSDILIGLVDGSFLPGDILVADHGTTFKIGKKTVEINYSDGVREKRVLPTPPTGKHRDYLIIDE